MTILEVPITDLARLYQYNNEFVNQFITKYKKAKNR